MTDQPLPLDACDRRVLSILYTGVARAYGGLSRHDDYVEPAGPVEPGCDLEPDEDDDD